MGEIDTRKPRLGERPVAPPTGIREIASPTVRSLVIAGVLLAGTIGSSAV